MEENKERSIDELIDLPYSEMTDDEIERVIEFKAACKARDETHKAQIAAIESHMQEISATHKALADKLEASLQAQTEYALRRLADESQES